MLGMYVYCSSSAEEHICGSHICLVIYVKCVYSAFSCMIDCSDFIFGAYMCIHLHLWLLKIWHIWLIYPIC